MSGLYTGAMGILSNMTRMDVIANNIANAQTKGYKEDETSFRVFDETSMVARTFKQKENIGKYQDMVYLDDIKTNFDEGIYQTSNQPLDMAITDNKESTNKNFFVVGKNDKQYLTRNGQFTLDGDRHLSTLTGELVMNENNQPITIPQGETYSVNTDGTILTDKGSALGKIKTVSVSENNLVFLQKDNASLFSVMSVDEIENRFGSINQLVNQYDQNITYQKLFPTNQTLLNIQNTGSVNILEAPNGEVHSYTTENSNVDLSKELVDAMETQRSVGASQKVWQALSELLDKESNQIGK